MIGAAWSLLSRWGMRLLGLLSTLVLARLLAPTDFGIVGMAMIVVGFSETLLEFGARAILIHRSNLTRDDYDTAWTLNLIQGVLAASVIAALSVPAAGYFDDERLIPVLLAMAGGMLIGGFMNIGIVDFQRNLDMHRDFMLLVTKKLASVIVSIVLALIYESYWAMVWGFITLRAADTVASYLMHSYRPRFSLVRLREFFGFSAWMMFRSLGKFAQRRVDSFIVAGSMGTATMGFYTIAVELTGTLVGEVFRPAARVLFPAYAAMQDQPERLRNAARRAIGTIATLSLPASAGVALVASDLVVVLLGAKWESSVPLLQLLAIASILPALTQALRPLLIGLGRVAALAITFWLQVGLLVLAWWLLFTESGAEGVAMARLLAGGGFTAMIFAYVTAIRVLRLRDLLTPLVRPSISVATMAVAVLGVQQMLGHAPSISGLVIQVAVGVVAYTCIAFMLWLAAGRPDGIELMIARKLDRRLRTPNPTEQ